MIRTSLTVCLITATQAFVQIDPAHYGNKSELNSKPSISIPLMQGRSSKSELSDKKIAIIKERAEKAIPKL